VCCLKLAPITNCDKNTSGRGSSTRISLSNCRRIENTVNTHSIQYHIIIRSRSSNILGSCISYTKDVWSQNHTSGDKSELAEVISLNVQNILFALEENASIGALSLRIPVRSPTLLGLDFPLTTLISIIGKRKQHFTCTPATTRAKLDRLHSGWIIHGDQKITTRHAMALNKTNELISLLVPITYY
jgi:hypothetical protein